MVKTLICTQCGFIGQPSHATKGSGLIEVVLWLTFIIPGIIYSIWRRSSPSQVCSKCKSQTLIPVDAPKAKKILEEIGQNQETYLEIAKKENRREQTQDKHKKIVWGFLFGLVVIVIIFVHLSSN